MPLHHIQFHVHVSISFYIYCFKNDFKFIYLPGLTLGYPIRSYIDIEYEVEQPVDNMYFLE